MIEYYRALLLDRKRILTYQKSISKLVKPGSIVVEIGAGLGTYSIFAARAGAKKVYAIEMSDVFYIGEEIVKRNGLSDIIQFIHGKSTEIDIPEKADIIIFEDFSPFFLYEGLEKIITDARNRFLKPGGTFLPNIFELKLALVESAHTFNKINCFEKYHDWLYGINYNYTTEIALNQNYYVESDKITFLTPEIRLKKIDLNKDTHFPFSFTIKSKIIKDGVAHGLIGWWDAYFHPKIYYSNSPSQKNTGWGQLFFPIKKPFHLNTDEEIEISLMAIESKYENSINYKWIVKYKNSEQEANTFRSLPIDWQRIEKFSLSSPVLLNSDGEILKKIFTLCEFPINWQKLAQIVMENFPDKIRNEEEGLAKSFQLLKYLIK